MTSEGWIVCVYVVVDDSMRGSWSNCRRWVCGAKSVEMGEIGGVLELGGVCVHIFRIIIDGKVVCSGCTSGGKVWGAWVA